VHRRIWWRLRGGYDEREQKWRESTKRKPSLTMALNASIFWWFWSGGILKVIADSAQVTSPLLVKVRTWFPSSPLYDVIFFDPT
jgi:hypothetical protein